MSITEDAKFEEIIRKGILVTDQDNTYVLCSHCTENICIYIHYKEHILCSICAEKFVYKFTELIDNCCLEHLENRYNQIIEINKKILLELNQYINNDTNDNTQNINNIYNNNNINNNDHDNDKNKIINYDNNNTKIFVDQNFTKQSKDPSKSSKPNKKNSSWKKISKFFYNVFNTK